MPHAIRLPCEQAAIWAAPRPAEARPSAAPWVLAATILGSSLAFIDGTVVTVALPSMARDFNAAGADLQWVVEVYSLFLSALLLVGGSLGDRFGRRRIFTLGIVLFAVASLGCAFARSMAALLVFRAVQGIGGALLVPESLALIAACFDPEARGKAIGTWSGFSGITSAVGPLLGGWLVNHSWRWAFFINPPVAAVVLLLLRRVPESRNPHAGRLDFAGASAATLSMGGMVYGLIESSRRGWGDPGVIAGLLLGAVGLVAFIRVEQRTVSPMLPFSLFRSSNFTGANLLTLFLYGALGCVFFFLPLDLIDVQGYSPLQAGASILPLIAVMFLLSRWSGGLVARYGSRRPLLVGPVIAAAGFFLIGTPGIGGSYWTTFFPGVLVLGFGMALSVAPLTTAVMGAVGEENAGIASGINNAVSRAAGLLAIALLGVQLAGVFQHELAHRVAALGFPHAAQIQVLSQREKLAAARPPAEFGPREAAEMRLAVAQSYVAGFRAVARASALLALLASACAWVWVDRRAPRASSRARPAAPARVNRATRVITQRSTR